MSWKVYLIRVNDGSLYCGCTNDVERRVHEHKNVPSKGSKYVQSRLPCELVYTEEKPSRSEAMKREAEIKNMRKDKKEKLVSNN